VRVYAHVRERERERVSMTYVPAVEYLHLWSFICLLERIRDEGIDILGPVRAMQYALMHVDFRLFHLVCVLCGMSTEYI
jgi:hypothetical protein